MSNSEDTLNKQFGLFELKESDIDSDPIKQFGIWYEEALRADLIHPNAFTLTTSTREGKPSARVLLLKDYDESGFVFYSNSESKKGSDLAENPFAAFCFWWGKLERQIRIEGRIEKVSADEADAYFATRPRGSQIGAWASNQSTVIPKRELLEEKVHEFESKFQNKDVPRPLYWNGYRLVPNLIEFWQGRDNRLHDRLRYNLQNDGGWVVERLAT
ncbi:MAG: pyridoxamine 5'-phosphate oxidase [Thermodesulfobacteriota bacterium]